MPPRKATGPGGAPSTDAQLAVRTESAALLSAGPVTARGVRTRSRLVTAARALFEKQGYLDTNVGDIARRARVAHGTFYTYFTSKEEIFAEVADALLHDFQRVADQEPHVQPGGHVSERIERANRGYLKAYESNARMMAVLEQVATFNQRLAAVRRASRRFWVQRGAESIRRWQHHGMVDERIDAAYAASALGSMVDRSAYVWIVLGEPYDREEAVIQLTRLYCNALGIPYHRDGPDGPSGGDIETSRHGSRALTT
ncbi:MAG: TetR/AcrR family transcriptional regulator [Ilumatobacteraceae bacterium]